MNYSIGVRGTKEVYVALAERYEMEEGIVRRSELAAILYFCNSDIMSGL